MSFSFLFFLFFFLTRIVAGQWWPQPRRPPLTRMQALTTLTLSPAQPTGPIASTSNTCSRRWPDPAATATTRTVAAPTAAAGLLRPGTVLLIFLYFTPCLTFSLRLMVTHSFVSCDHLLYRLVTWYVLVSLLLS